MKIGKPSAPPAPDYQAQAEAQGEANIEAARLSGRLSNPNYITPLGTQSVTFGTQQQFDQDAYDQAMQNYQQQLAAYQFQSNQTGIGGGGYTYPGKPGTSSTPQGPAPERPNRADFMTTAPGDQPTITQELTPEAQRIFDLEQQAKQRYGELAVGGLDRVSESLSQPFDLGGLPEISEGTTERDLVTQSILERNRPFMDRQRQLTEDELLIQGHNRGGSAWQAQQEDLARQENDARLAAILAGGQEQNRLYELESANRQRALQEQLMARQLPLNEVSALRSGSQVQLPQFQGYQGQSVNPSPVFNAAQQANQNQMARYNQEAAQQGQMYSNLFSLGGALGAAALMSDRRLKRQIRRVGEYMGLPVYMFKYLWSDQWNLGWMADEVLEVYPERVFQNQDGYLMVNYAI